MNLQLPSLVAASILVIDLSLQANASPIQLVSALPPGQSAPAGGGGDSYAGSISPDGRFVLFSSAADNLWVTSQGDPIPALIPTPLNLYLRDRSNATTILVSLNLTGTNGGNADSVGFQISTNGQFVLFESIASDLVPDDTNNLSDVFVRDLLAGTTALVSVSTNGGPANGISSASVMTPDGRYVAFVSAANNLVPNDTNGIPDVFVRDLQTKTTTLVSVGARSTNSLTQVGGSDSPAITPDGQFIAFYSTATNLVPGVTKSGDLYVRNVFAGTTVWASADARSAVQTALNAPNAVSYNHALSADGQFLVYEASPNPPAALAAAGLILRYHLAVGGTDVIYTNATSANGAYETARSLDISQDATSIAFVGNTNGNNGLTTCIFVWNETDGLTLASAELSGSVSTNATSDSPALTPDGRFVAFLSTAPNLVTNSLDGDYHLYVRDLQAATTTLVDADTNGVGSPLTAVSVPSISADGRFVAFDCPDSSLVPNDDNNASDVFVRDLVLSGTELISVANSNLANITPNGTSTITTYSVSSNGQFVAFASEASDLAANDLNTGRDIFLRDLALGTNILVSADTNGNPGDLVSFDPAISADGRFVAFSSSADNLVPGDSNKASDVFVLDTLNGTTALVSQNAGNTGPASGNSYSPVISASGRLVLFRSQAKDLASGTFTGSENLFLRDLQAGTNYVLTRAGVSSAAQMTPDGRFVAFIDMVNLNPGKLYVWDTQAAQIVYTNAALGLVFAAISPDGNRVAGWMGSGLSLLNVVDRISNATWAVYSLPAPAPSRASLRFSADGRFLAYNAPSNQISQVFLYDLDASTNVLVTRSFGSSNPANGASDSVDISADGRFVAYRSAATDLVASDNNNVPDVFLYDRITGATTLVSVSLNGDFSANNRSLQPVFSGDGQTLFFESWASDLIAHDFNQNSDVFALSLSSSPPPPSFRVEITAAATSGQAPSLSWPVLPGKNYRVQFKNALTDPNWQDSPGNTSVVGDQVVFQDPTPAPDQRFYRVVAF